MEKKKRPGSAYYEEMAQGYFTRCAGEGLHPSLPGLALALGFSSRRELEKLAAGDSKPALALKRAITQVEDANVQSIYKKESAASAKFILQNGFGYSEKSPGQQGEDITVVVGDAL